MAQKLSNKNLEYIRAHYQNKSNKQLAEELHVDKADISKALRDLELERDPETQKRLIEQGYERQNLKDTVAQQAPKIELAPDEIKKSHYLNLLILFFITFFIYSNSFQNEFVWDDEILIQNNYYVKDWKYIPEIVTNNSFRGGDRDSNFFRPMQLFTYLIDYTIWKDNAFGFHLSNTLFHTACALLIYILLFLLTKSTKTSFLTAFIYTIHPIHTEAVTYVSGRADSLSFMFSLLTCIFFVRYLQNKKEKNSNFFYLGTLLSFIAALLSKEMASMTPLFLLLIELTFFTEYPSSAEKTFIKILTTPLKPRYLSFIIILFFGYLPYRHFLFDVWDKPIILENITQKVPAHLRAYTFGRTFLFGYYTPDRIYHPGYVPLLFFPYNLHMERGVPYCVSFSPQNWQEIFCIFGWLLLISMFIWMCISFKRNRLVFFSLAWFFLSMFPYMDFVPLNANQAEHWLYVPAMGLFLLASIYLEKWLKLDSAHFSTDIFKKIFFSPFIVVLIFFCALTIIRNFDWKNDIVIWTQTAKLSNSSHIHGNLGVAYGRRKDYQRAMEEFRKATRLQWNYPEAHNNLGVLLMAEGSLDEAEKEFRWAVQFNPNYSNAHKNIGDVLVKKGDIAQARYHYEQAIRINPFHTEAKAKLASLPPA